MGKGMTDRSNDLEATDLLVDCKDQKVIGKHAKLIFRF